MSLRDTIYLGTSTGGATVCFGEWRHSGSKAECINQDMCHDYVLPFWLLLVCGRWQITFFFRHRPSYVAPICLSAWQTTVSFVTDGTNVPNICIACVREVGGLALALCNGLHNNIAHLKLRSIVLSNVVHTWQIQKENFVPFKGFTKVPFEKNTCVPTYLLRWLSTYLIA